MLQAAIEVRADLLQAGHALTVVAADQRMLRAAAAEGIAGFNPETQPRTDLDALLAS